MRAPKLVRDIRATAHLRDLSGGETVSEYSWQTRQEFKARKEERGVVPVIIPAHNEQEDLPATLVALARSERPVLPVVVANRCTDRTVQYASRMGAVVLEQPTGKKMAATQNGLAFARGGLKHRRVLFTDADSLPLPGWAGQMTGRMDAAEQGDGVALFGSAYIWHGPSAVADTLMTASRQLGIARRHLKGQPPLANGHNYGLAFDVEGRMDAAMSSLDPELFIQHDGPADDTLIQKVLIEQTDAAMVGISTLESRVLTRGDRVATAGQALRILIGRQVYADVTGAGYQQQYNQPPAQQ